MSVEPRKHQNLPIHVYAIQRDRPPGCHCSELEYREQPEVAVASTRRTVRRGGTPAATRHGRQPATARQTRKMLPAKCATRLHPATATNVLLDRRLRHPVAAQPRTHPMRVVRQDLVLGRRLQQPFVMRRACRLVRILPHCAVERERVRTRQHGERAQPLGPALGDVPRKAATPVVPDEVKAALAMPETGDDGQWRRRSTRRSCSWHALPGPAVHRVRSRADYERPQNSRPRQAQPPAIPNNGGKRRSRAAFRLSGGDVQSPRSAGPEWSWTRLHQFWSGTLVRRNRLPATALTIYAAWRRPIHLAVWSRSVLAGI
jgi:hypothetical protein